MGATWLQDFILVNTGLGASEQASSVLRPNFYNWNLPGIMSTPSNTSARSALVASSAGARARKEQAT
eukprot:SAG31_NODE_30073_length_385_cov_2.695804_1_plen_66_part_01